MPGNSPLTRSLDQALYESYSQGRAHTGGILAGNFAQWSAVNDTTTCDFCGWADERIFDIRTVPWDPPVHWGCRCLIAYIMDQEFTPDPDWGTGPPPSSYPPGAMNGHARGKPTLRGEGKKARRQTRACRYRFGKRSLAEIVTGVIARGSSECLDEDALDDVARSWDDTFGQDMKWDESLTRPWSQDKFGDVTFDFKYIDSFREDSVKYLLGEGRYRADVMKDLKDFLYEWQSNSMPEYKKLIEALGHGTPADVQVAVREVLRSIPGGTGAFAGPDDFLALRGAIANSVEAEVLQTHWSTMQEVSRRVFGQSPLVTDDGYVTLYRGLRTAGKDTVDDLMKALGEGDDAFVLGTEFVESWSTNKDTAEWFASRMRAEQFDEDWIAGVVIKKSVHIDDVMVTWLDDGTFAWNEMNEVLWANHELGIVPKQVLGTSRTGILEVEVW